MKNRSLYYIPVFILLLSAFSCGLDNERSEKEKEEDIRQGGNNVEYKDAQEVGAPSLSDTTKFIDSVDAKSERGIKNK